MDFPPVLTVAFGAVAAAALAKLVVKEWRRINEALHPAEPVPVKENAPLKTLRRDPNTGVYRPD